MRILHTSDWHLGRSFGTYGLLPDQEAFLNWFIDAAVARKVELVVIAGDIYDRPTPPAEAIRAFRRTVVALNREGIEVAAIAGNHDSAERVAVYSEFTESSGLVLRGGYPSSAEGTADVVVREYSDGPLAIAAIPFLDPRLIPADFPLVDPADGPFTHNTVVTVCAEAAAAAVPEGVRSVAIAHGFIAGATGSDSEKKLVAAVGNSDHIGAACFEPFSYTALGHLHRPQKVRGSETIRYSGTPLPYSFSETGQKSVVLVDMNASGECDIELLPIPVGKGVRTIRFSFAEISRMEPDAENLIRVELTDAAPIREAKRRLLDRFPHIVELSLVNLSSSISGSAPNSDDGVPHSLARQVSEFLAVATGAPASSEDFAVVIAALEETGLELPDAPEIAATLTSAPTANEADSESGSIEAA